MTAPKRLVRVAPLGIFLFIAVFLAIGLTKDPSKLPSNLIDKQAPEFELSELRESQKIITDEALSGRVTLLNVFGSWCQACLVEHPTLLKLKDENEFDLVGVNWRDTRSDALRWLKRFGDPYDYILFDADSALAIELGVTGAPETFIVGPNKRVRYKHVGPITEDVFNAKISPVILSLLDE